MRFGAACCVLIVGGAMKVWHDFRYPCARQLVESMLEASQPSALP
jgi:hypothetical protein